MPTVYRAKISQPISLPRKCEFCGHEYEYVTTVRVEVEGGRSAFDVAETKACVEEAGIRSDYHTKLTCGVLCPACNRFSSRSMREHFPIGFQAGLICIAKKMKGKLFLSKILITSLLMFLPSLFFGFYACGRWMNVPLASGRTLLVGAFIGAFIAIAIATGWSLFRDKMWNKALVKFAQSLNTMTDAELEAFVICEYRCSENSLDLWGLGGGEALSPSELSERLLNFRENLKSQPNPSRDANKLPKGCLGCGVTIIVFIAIIIGLILFIDNKNAKREEREKNERDIRRQKQEQRKEKQQQDQTSEMSQAIEASQKMINVDAPSMKKAWEGIGNAVQECSRAKNHKEGIKLYVDLTCKQCEDYLAMRPSKKKEALQLIAQASNICRDPRLDALCAEITKQIRNEYIDSNEQGKNEILIFVAESANKCKIPQVVELLEAIKNGTLDKAAKQASSEQKTPTKSELAPQSPVKDNMESKIAGYQKKIETAKTSLETVKKQCSQAKIQYDTAAKNYSQAKNNFQQGNSTASAVNDFKTDMDTKKNAYDALNAQIEKLKSDIQTYTRFISKYEANNITEPTSKPE